jgi:hypothetical protein
MTKLILFCLLLVISVIIFSCYAVVKSYKAEVKVIENCEYISLGNVSYTHKGNCTNSIHIYR